VLINSIELDVTNRIHEIGELRPDKMLQGATIKCKYRLPLGNLYGRTAKWASSHQDNHACGQLPSNIPSSTVHLRETLLPGKHVTRPLDGTVDILASAALVHAAIKQMNLPPTNNIYLSDSEMLD
jgi:hypothetical protein